MSDWLVLSQTCTSSGWAREFVIGLMDGPERCHAMAAERVGGGGDDSRVPRRAIGIGADRVSARRSLEETITAYDPAGRVVFTS